MADSKISALTAVTALTGITEYPVNESGVSKKATVNQQHMFNTIALSSDATANATTTAAKISGLDMQLPAGTYIFEYFIRYQSSATTTGVKFSVNHSGTVTAFVANMRYVDASATASTGAPKQNMNATTAGVMGSYSARAKSTAADMGPSLSVDTINSDMLMIIEGLMIVTVSGNIELYHASETAASTTVKAGTSLRVQRTDQVTCMVTVSTQQRALLDE